MLDFFVLFNLVILLPILIFGLIISKINNYVSKKLNTNSKWWIYMLCGAIGTPIHELSHLISNLLFGHKIEKVALFRPIQGKKDGVLGYVHFSYNPNSIYQNIGLFVSGIAPMIGGGLVLFAILKILLPGVFVSLDYFEISNWFVFEILSNIKDSVCNNIQLLFTNYGKIENLIIFLILSFSISSHMDISAADLKSALIGGIVLEVILIVVSILLRSFRLVFFTEFVLLISSYLISFLILGLIFSMISLAIAFVLSLF